MQKTFVALRFRDHGARRFDEPEDEPLSLQLCQPLMERLVTTLGGSLCSTLMVAESLEIIAHACRALAKLSDTNTTVQVREAFAVGYARSSRFGRLITCGCHIGRRRTGSTCFVTPGWSPSKDSTDLGVQQRRTRFPYPYVLG